MGKVLGLQLGVGGGRPQSFHFVPENTATIRGVLDAVPDVVHHHTNLTTVNTDDTRRGSNLQSKAEVR